MEAATLGMWRGRASDVTSLSILPILVEHNTPSPKCFVLCVLVPTPPWLDLGKCHQQRGAGLGGPLGNLRGRRFARSLLRDAFGVAGCRLKLFLAQTPTSTRGSLHLMYGC